ncbi:hypothetical protein ABZ540_35525 [Nocardia xishanensis]|uniref:hypothetical protein n=1 Tax=Nocardia xishanensis TaxID=238964 RepID=UPI0033CC365F
MAYVLNSARRRDSPLSQSLERLLLDSPLAARFDSIRSLEELEDFDSAYPQAIVDMRPQSPSLGAQRQASIREGEWRPISDGRSVSVAHHYVGVRIHGDHRLIQYWPDAYPDLEPVDAAAIAAAGDWAELDEVERHELQLVQESWHLGTPDSSFEEWGLYTYVELTPEEEGQVAANQLDVRSIIETRIAEARSIVDAIAAQTDRFFEVELPKRLKDRIAHKRERLTNRAAVSASLRFDDEWKLPDPKLEPIPPPAPTATSGTPSGAASGRVKVAHRDRLDPASFADVQRVIRMWANGVQSYPATFNPLGEDRLSDHLAVTLNASLANAKREVYRRSGKSDIFIQADILAEGKGPEKVFICEAKIASDDTVVAEAVDPQLFGYLNTHDTAAVLLLYFKQQDFDGPRDRRLAALRKVKGYMKDEPGPSGWPIFEYEVEGRYVRLCVASVHLPPKK